MASKVLIVYDSHHGVIERMAGVVASGVRAGGCEAVIEKAGDATVEDFLAYDAIILGSPCHFAGMSAAIKTLVDRTWSVRGRLEGKVGAAFTASEHIGGGNELALRAMIDAFLIHGMIVQGDPDSDFFGAVVIDSEGEAVSDTSGECHRLGQRVAQLVQKLA